MGRDNWTAGGVAPLQGGLSGMNAAGGSETVVDFNTGYERFQRSAAFFQGFMDAVIDDSELGGGFDAVLDKALNGMIASAADPRPVIAGDLLLYVLAVQVAEARDDVRRIREEISTALQTIEDLTA